MTKDQNDSMRSVQTEASAIVNNRREREAYQEACREAEARRGGFRSRIRQLETERDSIECSGVSDPDDIAEAALRMGQIDLQIKLTQRALNAVTTPEPPSEPHPADTSGSTRLTARLELARGFMNAVAERRNAEALEWMKAWGGTPPAPDRFALESEALKSLCPVCAEIQRLASEFPDRRGDAAFDALLELILGQAAEPEADRAEAA